MIEAFSARLWQSIGTLHHEKTAIRKMVEDLTGEDGFVAVVPEAQHKVATSF